MKHLIPLMAAVVAAVIAPFSLQAQPANDSFANRIDLTTTSATGSNEGAGTQNGEPNRIGGARFGATVWWTWTAVVDGEVTIDTFGSSFNTVLGVYTGSLGSLNEVVSNNDATGVSDNTSQVTFTAQAGTTYLIIVAGWRANRFSTPATGTIQLHLDIPPVVPSVAITSPGNNSLVAEDRVIFLYAQAETPNPPVTRVDYYNDSGLVGSAVSAPYFVMYRNAPLGTNHLYAVATDSASLTATSAVVNVAVLAVGVTIISPVNETTYLEAAPITVDAATLLLAGSMTNVTFFADDLPFGEVDRSPFNAVWSSPTPGVHRLTATGMDSLGLSYTSAPVDIAIARPLVPLGSVWKYLDDGSDQGAAWTAPQFDDSTWASGPAELGYGDGDEATLVGFGPDENNRYVTTYFRREFMVTHVTSYSNLVFGIRRDDGAVVYLNGVEVARQNMPVGPIDYLTYAAGTSVSETELYPATVPATALVEGTNVLAVEIHQATAASSDISFELQLRGVPFVIHNQPPEISLISPGDGALLLAPASITLTASATDADGSVTNVQFFADGVKLGAAAQGSSSFVWDNPPTGWHVVYASATDDEGTTRDSVSVSISVFDAEATPLAEITNPADGLVLQGPTNLAVTARGSALASITNVLFLANGSEIGQATDEPYGIIWTDAAFGGQDLVAVVADSRGVRGTSSVVHVTINTPPVNSNAPVIVNISPADGTTLGSLSLVGVTFSEPVFGVDASDLLVNGVPATGLSGSGNYYTFTFEQPALGEVNFSWQTDHDITDSGWPTSLPFDGTAPGATWTYHLVDLVPPTVVAKSPEPGAVLTNLSQVSVTFSEAVTGVNAADFLVNGTPAIGLGGSGANYTFSFAQPAAGMVNISWAANHGITDLASTPNAFNAAGVGATWSYDLDNRVILVASNSLWFFFKGTAEASSPFDAWRQVAFGDSDWSSSLSPFYYGTDPYPTDGNPGTDLPDMPGGYSCVFLRQEFSIVNRAAFTNLFLTAQSDDGFIAWINGVEVVRYNMPDGDIPYNGEAPSAINEEPQGGAPYLTYDLPDPSTYLVDGVNVLAVQAFNNQPLSSSDFGFNAQLYGYPADSGVVPPNVVAVDPPAGNVFYLTNVTVKFSEAVTGVTASDLLVNGVPASGFSGGSSNDLYTFSFTQPLYGTVSITWDVNQSIMDFDAVPKPFSGTAPSSTWQYNLLNPNAPVVAVQNPLAGATVSELTQLTVTFSKPVTGVDASDLRLNGQPASEVSGSDATYTFTFPQPPYGDVAIGWVTDHGIADLEAPPNAFEPNRPGSTWNYTLIDQTPPAIATQSPPAGAQVTNLTQITVTFTEPVEGVNGADLLINGLPASTVSGSGATYTFSFAQPNATTVLISWPNNHGIHDLARNAQFV